MQQLYSSSKGTKRVCVPENSPLKSRKCSTRPPVGHKLGGDFALYMGCLPTERTWPAPREPMFLSCPRARAWLLETNSPNRTSLQDVRIRSLSAPQVGQELASGSASGGRSHFPPCTA
eukprot:587387-Pyramimonas_sp.AAC.1